MKSVLIVAIYLTLAAGSALADWQSDYGDLLDRYVTPTGVRYAAWAKTGSDVFLLNSVTSRIGHASVSGMDRKEKLAFYLNAYNAWILKRILDGYPVKGPGNGSRLKRALFFRSKSITVAGEKTSFRALENEVIRAQFGEPRIHFALNCASASCPPLMDRPFAAGTFEADLDRLTRAYLDSNPEGVRLAGDGESVRLSAIFDWYGEDFSPDVLTWINRFRRTKVPPAAKVEFQPYDWSLNESP